ncbi:MAG: hypothetical protein K6T66_03655 [Peptococcaceae bacterium]|nr:hypothetical protein [Peptococcaceae bacterium]
MSALNDREFLTYAFKEALSREKHLFVKLKSVCRSTGDRRVRDLCAGVMASCRSRINILQREMKNFSLK